MFSITNISNHSIGLSILDGDGILSQYNLNINETYNISELKFIVNLEHLLDPSMNLLKIRKDVY